MLSTQDSRQSKLKGSIERKEKTTPFGVNLMRSQVLYRAAQMAVYGVPVEHQP